MNLLPVTFYSGALDARKTFQLYLPPSYHSTEKSYPVLYLLHGAHGSEIDWPYKGQAHITAQSLIGAGTLEECIIVMPNDGGYRQGTFYLDWYDGSGNFEQYMIYDLVHFVDQNYRTIADRKKRAIAGLSMGGFGAFILALRHPDLFGAAASMSGVLRPIKYWDQAEVASYVGPKEGPYARKYDLAHLARELVEAENRPELYFDCGQDDFLYPDHVRFVEYMGSIDYPCSVNEFSGSHTWDYWSEHLTDVLKFVAQFFAKSNS